MLTSLVVIAFARLAFGMLLPPMRADLGLSYAQAGTLGTITALGYLCFVLTGGVAAVRWGARATIVFGLLSVAVGFAGLSVASAYPILLLLMTLLGVGTAFSFAPMVSLLATWFPSKRGLVIGYMTSGIGSGGVLVGLLVPRLYEIFGDAGWRVGWALFSVTAILGALLVLIFVRNPPVAATGAQQRPPSAEKWLVYCNPRVITVALVYGIMGLAHIVQSVFIVSFMVESGFPVATAGHYLAMHSLLAVITGPLWGSASDYLGRGNSLIALMTLFIVAMSLPLLDQSLLTFFLHFLLSGLSVTGVFAVILACSADQVAPRFIPIAFSFVTLSFAVGQLVGPALAGRLIENTGDFRVAFGVMVGVLLVAAGLILRIRSFPRTWAVGEPDHGHPPP